MSARLALHRARTRMAAVNFQLISVNLLKKFPWHKNIRFNSQQGLIKMILKKLF
jgi:hypothetical protein